MTASLPRRLAGRALAWALALGLLVAAQPAAAKVLVLTFRGSNAAKVQSAVVAALTAAGHDASAGDTSFEDAAVLIGCDPGTDACADQVMDMLAVDELVFGSSSKSGEVTLSRAAAGKPRQSTKVRVEGGQALDAAVAPGVRTLFGEPDAAASKPPVDDDPVAVEGPPAAESPPPPLEATSTVSAASTTGATAHSPVDEATSARRWAMISWGSAGAAAAVGMVFWLRASALQDDIDSAPNGTPAEVDRLLDLESRAETSATLGNVLVVVSAGLAGVGTYYWIKHRRARQSHSAALAPMVLEGGGGLVLTVTP